MSLGLDKAMLLISSYSNPVETLEHARSEGYILRDFMLTSMPFGTYSSEPKVCPFLHSCQTPQHLSWCGGCLVLGSKALMRDVS